jgi:signal transduction histidine kinase
VPFPPSANIARQLRVAALLWSGYLVCMIAIDMRIVVPGGYPWFSIANLALACVVFVLGAWQWAQKKLGRALLPTAIFFLSAAPIVVTFALVPYIPRPLLGVAEGLSLRLTTPLFLGLILTTWNFPWRYAGLYCAGCALLTFAMLLLVPATNGLTTPGVVFILSETAVFLALSYFLHTLLARMRAQQASLEQANAKLSSYAGTLEQLAISRERNRVARELHDTLAHTLTGMTVQLETVKAYWDVDSQAARELLNQVLEASRSGVQETRLALKALRASPLDDLGLSLALRQLAESAAERGNLALQAQIPENVNLAPEREQCIYRVAQEALENIVRHAHAQTLAIRLIVRDQHITLEILDDGKGFTVNGNGKVPDITETGHYGLAGMYERAALAGGTLEIASALGQGTRVVLNI